MNRHPASARRLTLVGVALVVLAAPLVVPTSPAYAATSTARVRGGVMQVRGGSEVVVPLPDVTVTQPSVASQQTDQGGRYTYNGVSASVDLDGAFFNLTDSCPTTTGTANGSGDIVLGPSATDCTTPLTRAGRTATYYADLARRLGRKWLPSNAWAQSLVPLSVNINTACSSAWDSASGTMQLMRSGGGCTNSGESADIVLGIWRAGLDDNNANGSLTDLGTHWGFNDAFSVAGSRDPCVAPGYQATGETAGCPGSLRDVSRVVTTSNVTTVCTSSGGGVFGRTSRCEGHLVSGSLWDLRGLLLTRLGTEEGWNQYEKLVVKGSDAVGTGYTATAAGNAGCGTSSALRNVLTADDDNANLGDGTPNADLIQQAFTAHGLGCTSLTSTRHQATCLTPPGQPAVSAANEAGAVRLTWPAVSGATGYRVYRRMPVTGFKPFLQVGSTVTSPSFLDAEVFAGTAYEYEVVAVNGSCTSRYGTPTPFTPSSDSIAPTNPALSSTDHALSTWSKDATIGVAWSGATDTGGSGVAGYSFQWSTAAQTVPDKTVDANAASTGTTSPALADGSTHYFHLRTIDVAGNASTAIHLGPFRIDTTAPTGVAITSTLPVFSTAPAMPLAWTGSDGGSGVATYDVVWRASQSGSDFGPAVPFKSGTTSTAGTFTGASGHTYCFSVRATDLAGNESNDGPAVCTAMPLRASSLGKTGRWRTKAAKGSYLGAYLESKKKGSTLNAVVQAKRIAIVVTTCRRCGKVLVKLGRQILKRVSLTSPRTRRRQVIGIASFSALRSGTLTISVKGSHKAVRVEGLAISRV